MTAYPLGLRHPDRSRLVMPLTLTGAVPVHPATADYLTDVPEWNGETNFTYGTCVVPDTRVLTADLRWVRAGDLSAGDRIVGFDENHPGPGGSGRKFRATVVESAEIVSKPCYDLEFEDGTTVRCSDDHRWLTKRGWVTTDELGHGAQVLKPVDAWDIDGSRDAGYLAGAFDGEGCLTQRDGRDQLVFAQVENEALAETERLLKEQGFDYRRHVQIRPGQQDLYKLAIYRTPEVLRFLGSMRPVRLLGGFHPDNLNLTERAVRLVTSAAAGIHEVVKLETSTRTYLAEGLASHNCGPVSVANSAISAWRFCLGQAITVSDSAIFDLYRASGNPNFDPNDPGGPGDAGVDMTVMLAALLRVGLKITHPGGGTETVKPICFARVSFPPVYDDLHATTSIFGGVTLAALLDVAQQDQTDAGLWDYVPGSGIWGGHAFHGGAYTSATGIHQLDVSQITWMARCGMTPGFVNHQVEDGFVLVWEPTWYSDHFQAGVNQEAMAADYTAVTGRPWPGPAPAPAPPPPVPFPAPVRDDDADIRFAQLLARHNAAGQQWPDQRHFGFVDTVARAARDWRGFRWPNGWPR